MIIILSEPDDYSTKEVLYWLLENGENVIRINYSDSVIINELEIKNGNLHFIFECNGNIIDYKNVKAFYYRRGYFNIDKGFFDTFSNNSGLNRLLNEEIESLHEFIQYLFDLKNAVGNYSNRKLNKLLVLKYAEELGIDIPQSYICRSKKELEKITKKKNLITKHISEIALFYLDGYRYTSLTYDVDVEFLTKVNDRFMYSLFQENIIKNFEVRSFYLKGKFYSSAMFTQNNNKTKVDFRNYDDEKPTRIIPFKLPDIIEGKLRKLFDRIDLNTGSIDMIFSQGKYYFLEINPVGQYGMISEPCNYYLEREVVKELIN